MEQDEARVYSRWRSTVDGVLTIEDLRHFVALSTNNQDALRTTPVWISSENGREHLPMVPAAAAVARLGVIVEWLARGQLGGGTLRAVRVLALLNNAHAFIDGNGRLGRALFNFCLHDSGMPATCFIPLKSIAALSVGGYELSLREAELLDRWDCLLSYHCNAIKIISRLGHMTDRELLNKDE